MSDAAIAALTRRNEELAGQVTTLNAEARSRRFEVKKLKGELEKAQVQLTTLGTERDDFRKKAESGPSELQARVDELQGQLDSRDHSDAFNEALRGFKVKSEQGDETAYALNTGAGLADVWGAIQYTPKGAKPDGAKAAELLGQALKARPYLFAAAQPAETATTAPGGAQTAIRTPATPPGPGASRSDASRSESQHQPASARSQIDAAYAALGRDKVGRIA